MSRDATYPAATNLLRLVRMLLESHYGIYSFSDIRKRLEISAKTLSRYVKVLDLAFDDLIAVRTGAELGRDEPHEKYLEFKRYALEGRTGYQLAPLYLSRFFMSFLEGTLLDESLGDAVSLFEGAVERPHSNVWVGEFGQKFYAVGFGPKSYADHDEIIETILQGLIKQNPLVFTYRKPGGETKEYNVEPLSLIIYKQGLYLIGANEQWERPHFFAVERMVDIKRQTDQSFNYPRDYSPEALCRGSFGIYIGEEVDVRIRFTPDVPHEFITSRRWHASQQVKELPDGGLELRMRVSGTQELYSWVLGFGAGAEVLEPIPLREQITKELNKMVLRYQ